MRVLTHNLLCCLKCDHYPLKINAIEKVESSDEEEDLDFIVHMLPRLEYSALKSAAKDLGIEGLPDELPANVRENEQALKALHRLLMAVHVKQGELVCEACERVYPIMTNGIPNMLLRDDEVKFKRKAESKKDKYKKKMQQRGRRVDSDSSDDDDDDADMDDDGEE